MIQYMICGKRGGWGEKKERDNEAKSPLVICIGKC